MAEQGTFDPSVFGFEMYTPKRGGYRKNSDSDYLIFVTKGTGRQILNLSLSAGSTEFVRELIGDRVNMYINDKGHILLAPGNSLKLSTSRLSPGRSRISCDGLADKVMAKHGQFKRLYLGSTLYGSGNAMLFKPNGERDM